AMPVTQPQRQRVAVDRQALPRRRRPAGPAKLLSRGPRLVQRMHDSDAVAAGLAIHLEDGGGRDLRVPCRQIFAALDAPRLRHADAELAGHVEKSEAVLDDAEAVRGTQ